MPITTLTWCPDGIGWSLFARRRRMGRVVPDNKHPNMWRPVLSGGRLGDMANLSWARSAVYEAAVRELEWEARHQAATAPTKCPEKRAVFEAAASPIEPRPVLRLEVRP